MAPSYESRTRGLEELRWQSLTRPEKQLVAGLLEAARDAPGDAHLENVAYELREAASGGVPVVLVLTNRQNRAVAQVIEQRAEALEASSARFEAAPAVARSAHYAAGFLRSLVDRLVRGGSAAPEAAQDRIVQLLLLDAPRTEAPELGRSLVRATDERLEALGVGKVFLPVLQAYAPMAVVAAATQATRAAAVDDSAFDFEIVDVTEERVRVAEATFDASMAALGKGVGPWSSFLSDLEAGRVPGCEAARDYADAAESAARTAYEIVSAIRTHLQELSGYPWEAVSPGLKAIVDAYPALKRQSSLKDFIRVEVARRFEVRGKA